MQDSSNQQTIPFGLWELDPNGTVRHYEPEIGECGFVSEEVRGRNFFQLVPSSQTEELRNQVQRFILGSAPAHSFDLMLQLDGAGIRTRVLLANTRATRSGAAKLILLHIRRAETSSAKVGDGRRIL